MVKRMTLMAAATTLVASPGPASAVSEWRYTESAGSISDPGEASPGGLEAEVTAPADGTAPAGGVPTNNMTMKRVTERFGDPEKQAPAVGQPPITRWYYPRYTVYFEHDRVIVSVIDQLACCRQASLGSTTAHRR